MLTAQQVAATFAQAQGSSCVHKQNRLLVWMSRLFFRDLYEVIRFYRRSTETTDIHALRAAFPGVTLTTLAAFLEETDWADRDRTFEDLSRMPLGTASTTTTN